MNKLLKTIMMLGLSLTLVNCKTKFVGNGIIEIEDDETTTDVYTGDLKELRYYRGGWFGIYPNFAHDLTLKIDAKGKIKAHLSIPECEMEATATVDVYAKLESMLNNARIKVSTIGIVDVGHNVVTLTYPDGEQDYHLSEGDGTYGKAVIVKEDAEKIQALLESLIDEIKAKKINDCEVSSSELATVRYQSREGGVPPFDRPYMIGQPVYYHIITKDISLKKSNGKHYISGSITNGYEYTNGKQKGVFCKSEVNNALATEELVKLAHQIKIEQRKATCAIAQVYPYSSFYQKFTLKRSGSTQEGYVGCWNERAALNTANYTQKLLELFNKHAQQKCY